VGQHNVGERVPFERRRARQKFECDDTEAVEIRAFVLRAFRRQVGRSSQKGAGPGDASQVDPPRDPEVGEFGDAVRSDEDVGGLDVAVNDAGGVGVSETPGNLNEQRPRLVPAVWAMFGKALPDRGPVDVLQRKVRSSVPDAVAENLDHMR
jgi:hypothetical protein